MSQHQEIEPIGDIVIRAMNDFSTWNGKEPLFIDPGEILGWLDSSESAMDSDSGDVPVLRRTRGSDIFNKPGAKTLFQFIDECPPIIRATFSPLIDAYAESSILSKCERYSQLLMSYTWDKANFPNHNFINNLYSDVENALGNKEGERLIILSLEKLYDSLSVDHKDEDLVLWFVKDQNEI